jgi:O-antigen ligase
MNWKVIGSSLFISLYLQGLSLYFYLSGATGSRTSSLTGTFFLICLFSFLIISCNIKEARQNLLRFGLLEVLCLCFFGLFLYDYVNNPVYLHLPQNILFQFSVYTISLFVARGLTFKQFKWCFYFTTFIAVFTSLLLLGGFLNGSATSVAYGSRLVSGDAGNPIETGHLGSYAASASILLSVLSNSLGTKLLFLVAALPGALIAILSGTRSAVISLSMAVFFILGTTLFMNLKGSRSLLKRASITAIVYYTLIIFAIGLLPLAAIPTGDQSATSEKHGFDVNGTITRISTVFSLGEEDQKDNSILERREFYDNAVKAIADNPLSGKKLYSSGFVHNVFLQTTSEYGILGIVTYTLPVIWLFYYLLNVVRLSINQGFAYFKTDAWMITTFTVLLSIQTIVVMVFHNDPYRSYFTPCVIGVMIAFSRLGLAIQLNRLKPHR